MWMKAMVYGATDDSVCVLRVRLAMLTGFHPVDHQLV